MTNEELISAYRDSIIAGQQLGTFINRQSTGESKLRAELLRRLASSVPAGPRCTKCGAKVAFDLLWPDVSGIVARCENDCRFILENGLIDCAKFFSPSPATEGQTPQVEPNSLSMQKRTHIMGPGKRERDGAGRREMKYPLLKPKLFRIELLSHETELKPADEVLKTITETLFANSIKTDRKVRAYIRMEYETQAAQPTPKGTEAK